MLNIDHQIRQAAFSRLKAISARHSGDIPWEDIANPIPFGDDAVLMASRAIGIFKPKQMLDGILSIKTVVPKQGRINIYADSASDEGGFWYSLESGGLSKHANKQLMISYERNDPIIYFIGVAPGRYFPLWPCYIDNIDLSREMCHISLKNQVGITDQVAESPANYHTNEIQKRYIIREVKSRVHQAAFRARVIQAYSGQCAMTGLPIPQLLEAAHIIPDAQRASSAQVNNGISLSRLHHRAFDTCLIGIDPDYQIHVKDTLLDTKDGPFLENLKQLHGQILQVPHRQLDRPNRDALALRYEQFINS